MSRSVQQDYETVRERQARAQEALAPAPIEALMEALRTRPQTIMVCYSKCWSCQFNEHDAGWHTWADGDDVAHALSTGQQDPSRQRCGCYCQKTEPTT